MFKVSVRRLITVLVGASALLAPALVFESPAFAIPPPPSYKVQVTKTQLDKTDFRRRVGACTSQNGGTCTISSVSSVSTTISVTGGVSVSFVAGQIGFSTSRTSSSSASCTSPGAMPGDDVLHEP